MTAIVEFFRVLASVMNVVMFLSPIPTVRDIYRTKSTGHMPFVPLATMISNAHIWMVYGWLSDNIVALFASCAFGVAVAIVYVAIYYHYTTERNYAHKVLAVVSLVVVVNSLYAILGANGYTNQSYDGVRLTVGYIGNVSSVIMYSSPLEKIRQVFQHRSGVFIPIQIVVVGSINSGTWVVFSLLQIDWLVFAPNLLLLVIGLMQIALYWYYHPSKTSLRLDGDTSSELKDLEITAASQTQSPARSQAKTDTARVFVALRSPV